MKHKLSVKLCQINLLTEEVYIWGGLAHLGWFLSHVHTQSSILFQSKSLLSCWKKIFLIRVVFKRFQVFRIFYNKQWLKVVTKFLKNSVLNVVFARNYNIVLATIKRLCYEIVIITSFNNNIMALWRQRNYSVALATM